MLCPAKKKISLLLTGAAEGTRQCASKNEPVPPISRGTPEAALPQNCLAPWARLFGPAPLVHTTLVIRTCTVKRIFSSFYCFQRLTGIESNPGDGHLIVC